MINTNLDRRAFSRGLTIGGVATALGRSRIAGAGERIGVGLIGAGGKGTELWKYFVAQPEVNPVAVADVYEPFVRRGVEVSSGRAKAYKDFRRLLENRDVDAVIIATPDHWHALQTIAACRAGKDVYVEKPLSLVVHEGRAMVDEARKARRVVQVGSQQRSAAHFNQAVKLIHDGAIGDVHAVTAGVSRNVMPGFVPQKLGAGLTSDFDWDMWLGPAPHASYDPFRCIYNFRWFWDYSGGQLTNWGAHHLDIVRWALDAKGPTDVAGFGGRFAMKDRGETPDVQNVIYRFPRAVVTWTTREVSQGRGVPIELHGTKGTLALSRGGFTLTPEVWTGNDQDTGRVHEHKPAATALQVPGPAEIDIPHVRNFLDCIKSRQRPTADIEDGHRSATMCHLGNIATRLGRSLKWDPDTEEIVGDREAAARLTKAYRKPWALV